ncbi:MAG: hypothetical protein U1C59_02750 [Methylotenera sp.]|nr:hypothetical protein [Methylotenera sp.]
MDQHNDKVKALLKEALTLFPNSLTQTIKASLANSNGVLSASGVAIITKIDNVKTAAASLVNAFETEQSKSVIGEFCLAALTAKADLVRLLHSPGSAIFAEVKKEASRFEDVIEDLWMVEL